MQEKVKEALLPPSDAKSFTLPLDSSTDWDGKSIVNMKINNQIGDFKAFISTSS